MSAPTNVTITNPLVLYRSLVATNRIRPDPAQHRLAIHFQKLYDRLTDYEPAIDYSRQLSHLNQVLSANDPDAATAQTPARRRGPGLWRALLAQKEQRDTLALTRSLTDHEAAMQQDSPQGLLLHGAVGTGKSMLVDLFAGCLPREKKGRWHYNTFMLGVIGRLEELRRERGREQLAQRMRAANAPSGDGPKKNETALPSLPSNDHALLWLARDLICTSPILFLDEFQLPDRMAAKTLSGLFTCFFRLGGVLIATSNRLPDELAKAAGMEYGSAPGAASSILGKWGIGGAKLGDGRWAGQSEFASFLDLLKARCEVWEMEGKSDYRRSEAAASLSGVGSGLSDAVLEGVNVSATAARAIDIIEEESDKKGSRLPSNYITANLDAALTPEATIQGHTFPTAALPDNVPFQPATIQVYGRRLDIPRFHNGISLWTFNEICGATLGPADYISLASTSHTLLITDIPVLVSALKNEARRFITLLDALYEAKCKLFVSAAVGPDDLFFPDLRARTAAVGADGETIDEDALHAETFAEIHQDLTSPFRPNISSYSPSASSSAPAYPPDILSPDALEDDPPNRFRRNALAELSEQERMLELGGKPRRPNFGESAAFVGDDERFAYKRAASRLWEMCSDGWWRRTEDGWWRPVAKEQRHWERSVADVAIGTDSAALSDATPEPVSKDEGMGDIRVVNQLDDEILWKHGGSPFRERDDAPPRIQPEHVWGVTEWGKKAGPWGKGVDGLPDRDKNKR